MIAAGGGLAILLVLLGLTIAFLARRQGPQPSLQLAGAKHLRLDEQVRVRFDQPIDSRHLELKLTPPVAVKVKASGDRELIVTPATAWAPAQRYQLRLGPVSSADHSTRSKSWQASFTTQPKVEVAQFTLDGKPAAGQATGTSQSQVGLVFTVPMNRRTVTVTVNQVGLPAKSVAWAQDSKSATVTLPPTQPYQAAAVGVAKGALSRDGDSMTANNQLRFNTLPLEPANTSSGIDANFKPVAPIEIVIENSGPARPQSGFQQADFVYEYISEYSISRMTAIYFNSIPSLIGPVRSCRMVNPYLDYAFRGLSMCSGASVGTLHYMFGDGGILPLVPGIINDFDRGNHFFRVGFKEAPHNVYTTADRADRLRHEGSLPPPNFIVDPPHPDVEAGQPADAPFIGLHAVNYGYDAGSKQYLRFDHGSPFIDDLTHGQLAAKNVVIIHVPFHDPGWVEDETGGAHSVWYDMLGAGAAEIYSDGRVIHGQWHMGATSNQWYFQNDQAPWFTDEQGNLVRLNSGLTWVHVLGNGQAF
jgi:hypothetical protein